MNISERLKGWSWWAYLPAVAATGALIGLLWWFVIGRAENARTEAATARVDAGMAGVQAGNAKDAVAATIDQGQRQTIIREITRENTIRIEAAPGAGDAVPPAVWREFLGAVCLRREATRSDPACAKLSGSGEGHAGEADAVSPAAQ